MVGSTFFPKLGLIFRISKGTRALQLNRATILANQKLTGGIFTLILSLLIAVGSHHLSAQSAREDWAAANPPPKELWDQRLAALGLSPVLDEKTFVTLTRGLAFNQELPFGVLVTAKPVCLTLFGPKFESLPSRLFCRPFSRPEIQNSPPPQWELLGYGWAGYRAAEATLAKPRAALPMTKKIQGNRQDPREIQY